MSPERSEIDHGHGNTSGEGWRKRHDVVFLLLILGCLLLFLALFTYDPDDVAWSVVGVGQTDNSAGRVGAYIADFLLHGLGYLAFAFPALIMAKAWLLFRKAPAIESRVWALRALGLLLILVSFSGLAEVSIWEGKELPAGAGGIVGQVMIGLLVPLFGFIGTVLIYLVGLALGLVLFLEFSWLQFFERVGGVAFGVFARLTQKNGRQSSESAISDSESEARKSQPAALHADSEVVSEEKLGVLARVRSIVSGGRGKKTRMAEHDDDPVSASSVGASNARREPLLDSIDESVADELDGFDGFSATSEGASDFPPWNDDADEADVPAYERRPLRKRDSTGGSQKQVVTDHGYQAPEVQADQTPQSSPPVSHESVSEIHAEPEKTLRIEPLEKRESRPSDRAKRDLQGNLFKGDDPLPSIALLDPPRTDNKSGFSEERLRDLSDLLVQKLADFGVKVEVTAVAPGPVITRFEIQPAPGVKASKISNLAKDLARSMAMVAVRVVEVIPGKSVMGIEVPNENRAVVTLGEVLSSEDYDKSKSPLTLALGHDIAGNPVITDLAKMPHLLVAGTTGSGKSVGVNAMLISLLFKSTPEELRLILVDPKMLELSVYEGIPHLLTPVITDMKEAASGLRWSVAEMERRYQLMAAMGVRNIAGYNKKVKEAIAAGTPIADPLWRIDQSFDTTPPTLEPLPYVVIVIDEFADMMMMVGKKVEELIARIAQKARAAGIHMILATQRPSVDVITGLIKANVPTRIAFQVSSKIDSRTILDQGGAEQLLGHGDMLFMPPGCALPERVHGAFVDDDEVHRVVAEWKQRGEPDYIEEITQIGEDGAVPGAGGDSDGEQDDLYDQAVAFVTESGKCSISSVQRKLRIGYNRAARLVETMEAAGVVSPPAHNGSREVLAPPPV